MFSITGFDGEDHKFNFSHGRRRKHQSNKSKLHVQARELISELFPNRSVYEEVTLPGSKRPGRTSLLYADFFIPDLMLVLEPHGRQHYEYVPFFYQNRLDFAKAQRRDRDKKEWCELNDILLVELPYNETKQWKQIVQESLKLRN